MAHHVGLELGVLPVRLAAHVAHVGADSLVHLVDVLLHTPGDIKLVKMTFKNMKYIWTSDVINMCIISEHT